tara:strand:+ start:150 stop:515 length:366 start_codon:yes stop_codon:yes gene_type:complete
MTTKVTVKKMKVSPALTEEQQLAMLDGFSLRSGGLALTNHEAEYRLQELSKAAAGIKKLFEKAKEDAYRAAMVDQRPGPESRLRNEMVLRRLRRTKRGIEMVLRRVDSLVSEYELKDGLKK